MRPRSERLAPADEANLVLDHSGQINVFLVAGTLSPGGFVGADGRADLAALRAALRNRIAALPALTKVVAREGRHHVWRESEADLDLHVRETARVAGIEGLEAFCARLMTVPLDMRRPLWEMLIVPGAGPAGPAVILRVHHAIADGMAAIAIVNQLFDASTPWAPVRTPQPPGRRRPLARLGYGLRRIRATFVGHEVGETALLGDRSDSRGVLFLDADLSALETRTRRQGATINDGLLAAVAAGYRAALSAAGERIPERFPVSIPVALDRRGPAGNQVGVMLARLPLGLVDPDERLGVIAAQTRAEKLIARDQGTLEFMRGPIGARVMDRLARGQHVVGGFVTNLRGPDGRQSVAGAPIDRIWPVAVIAANVRLGVAALSVGGRLCCGIHFDEANVPGAEFARAMREELDRLVSASDRVTNLDS